MILFKAHTRANKWVLMSIILMVFLSGGRVEAGGIPGIPEIPKVPAFLPTLDQVPAGQPMPLDGVWLIPSIGKKIRIDAGRGYAVDPWLHLFVLEIQPGMVVLRNIRPTGPGRYAGEDLPLMGQFSANVEADQSIRVTVAGMLGPLNYKIIPVQLNNPGWYQQEMKTAGLGNQQFNSQMPSNYQFSNPNKNNQGHYPNQNPPNYQPGAAYQPEAGYQPKQQVAPDANPQEEADKKTNKRTCQKVEYDPDEDNYICLD